MGTWKHRALFVLVLVLVAGRTNGEAEKNEKLNSENDDYEYEDDQKSNENPAVYSAEVIDVEPSDKPDVVKTHESEKDVVKPPAAPAAIPQPKTVSHPRASPPEVSGKLIKQHDYTNYDSLRSRVAPPMDSQRGGLPFIITEQRLKELRSEFMYWYFDQGGSDDSGDYQKNIHSSSPQLHKNLNFQLPFYGFRFNYTRVSMNGYLEFSDPPEQYMHYPLSFPNKDWPKSNDPSFIGIFYSKTRIGAVRNADIDQRKPGVYFRLERDLQTRTDQFGIEVRERLKWDIREGVIGSETFDPKHAIFITWKNMSFAGGIDNSLYTTNTFQLILATDEVYTYAIFNYLDIQWTSHTEAGGDTTKGEGGVPAYVGFNAGNGTQSFEYYPYSQRSTIRDLTGRGWANGFKGRHIFRIDEKILLGTCNKDIAGVNLPLMFAPESGNMLGGTVVNITGPCFEMTDKVTCRFDTEEVRGTVVDRNRAICIQPRNVYADGYIRFEISIGPGKYDWKGKFFIETPATAAERIYFEDNSVYEKNPAEIKITWEKYNLTTNQNAPIKISLWGYKETTIRPQLEYIDIIEESQTNTGQYVISPASFRNRNNYLTNDMKFGFIQINLTESTNLNGLLINPVIWSKPIPLGWYFGPQWERLYGIKWTEYLCDNWLKNDRYLKNFANELPQCPCTLEHALADKGRFLPDFECDKDANPKCMYHKGALHCVRSGAPSLEGSEQQCCYDKNGYLMLSYDQQWGSRPFRSHNLGYLPWNEANKVPTLSQWFHDVIPFYTCCLWQHEQSVGCETFRFERRPSQDCVAYQSPAVATVFGDPHVVTFDNLEYTFNGKGEFVLVRTNTKDQKLDVQGRFEQLPENQYGEVKATQLTSVVARGNNSAVIEVRLRPRHSQWRYRLDVFADGKRIYFDRSSLKFQHFPGVTVYTPTYILNQSEVIMMFESGAGVEVLENKGYMSTRVYLPWTFINNTRGLFGNWSFDITDDLTLPDGTRAAVTSNLNDFERIHKDFGIYWILDDKENKDKGRALFKREFGRTSSYFSNKTFDPMFKASPDEIIPPNRTIYREQAKDFCGPIYQCQYDYAMSLDRDLAHFSKNYLNSYVQIRQLNNDRVISCGVLETPRFGRKSNFLFVPGTKVMFECNENFILIGDKRRICLPSGRWDVPEYGYTECLRIVEYESMTAGITTGIVFGILVPIIVCIAGTAYCIINHNDNKSTSWVFTQPRSRSNSRSRLNEDSRQLSPMFTPETSPTTRVTSPVSDASTTSGTGKKKRTYDKVYRTNEPLEGKPDVYWEDKDWDIPSSPEESEPETKKSFNSELKNRKPSFEPEYSYVQDDNLLSRTGTMDSGLGNDYTMKRPQTLYVPANESYTVPKDLSTSQPILNYNDDDYAEVFKPRIVSVKKQTSHEPQPASSFSSRITEV